MGGSIVPERARCACGGKFIKKQFKKQDYWECDTDAEHEPKLFRLRRYVPGIGGKRGRMVDIRYDRNGERFRSVTHAETERKMIDIEIEAGTFRPQDYLLKETEDAMSFKNFVENEYLPHYEIMVKSGKVKPSTMKAKKQYIRNYLLPFFTGKKLEKIPKKRITRAVLRGRGKRPDEFHEVEVPWATNVRSILDIKKRTITELEHGIPWSSKRMRDLVMQELKVILTWAKKECEIEELVIPDFPAPSKRKKMDVNSFLTEEENQKVFKYIKNPQYRIMIETMWFYAMRPSEVRALKWSDIDWKNELLYIRRHVTMNCIVVPGRKSQDDEVHALPLDPYFTKLIQELPRPINQDQYMFPGVTTEIVPEIRLRKVWTEALKRAGLAHVDMYRGTKSSRLSQLLAQGWSMEEIRELTGHTSVGMVALYAQLTEKQKVGRVREMLRASGEK